MREEGTVIEARDHQVVVRMEAGPQCGRCCACAGIAGNSRDLVTTTTRPLEVGTRVAVEVPTGNPVLGALLVFVLPLLGLVAGVVAGQSWHPFGLSRDSAGLVLGFGALAALFGLAAAVDRFVRRKLPREPKIVAVLSTE